ncbi:MAG: hypothetical protein LBR68_05475, partial [Lachnoclostridium sp.]|nr:hypothetical protein [Lachnoclostridium sp.]
MGKEIIHRHRLGDMSLLYECDSESQKTGFIIIPADMESQILLEKKQYELTGLIQVKLTGDRYSDAYANGVTMRNNDTTDLLKYHSQMVEETDKKKTIKTFLHDERGYEAVHCVTYYYNEESFEVHCQY